VGGVEAINDLATLYSAGGTAIVTEILAHPWAERQPSKAVLRDEHELELPKLTRSFVTFLFGAQYLMQSQRPTDRWVLDDRQTHNVGSRPR
jgi:hypothetical protein